MRLFTTTLLLLVFNLAYTQIETLEYAHSADTCVPANIKDYNRLIKYFMEDETETKQLYKINIMLMAFWHLPISYERKINKRSTFEIDFMYTNYFFEHSQIPLFKVYDITQFDLGCDYKFYHNIDRRISLNKNISRFSGNYFSIGIGGNITFYNEQEYFVDHSGRLMDEWFIYRQVLENSTKQSIVWRENKYLPYDNTVYLRFGYGMQRSIGNIGFICPEFKFNIGTNYSLTQLYLLPEIGIKAGFAFKSFKKNK